MHPLRHSVTSTVFRSATKKKALYYYYYYHHHHSHVSVILIYFPPSHNSFPLIIQQKLRHDSPIQTAVHSFPLLRRSSKVWWGRGRSTVWVTGSDHKCVCQSAVSCSNIFPKAFTNLFRGVAQWTTISDEADNRIQTDCYISLRNRVP